MTATPTPDPTVALSLMRRGYWIAPLTQHRKNPPKFGTRTHAEILAENDKSFLDACVIESQHRATGWAAMLRPSDPLPLAVVDVDAYGITADAAWAMLLADPMPPGLGLIKSASGGWHFWFRLPNAESAKELDITWTFGNNRAGEVRAGWPGVFLIVLPGSVVRNKHGDLGRYESAGHPLTELDSLAFMPDTLLTRLRIRGKTTGVNNAKGGLATEAHHLISLLHFISEIPPGEQNAAVAKAGQIAGRIGPADRPPPDLVSAAWDAMRDRLPASDRAHPWTFSDFEKTFQSGYKSGRKSGVAHQPSPDCPTESDVLAECQSALGGLPWLIEVTNGKGEFQEFFLGVGGEPARAKALISIKDRALRDIMAELVRLVPTVDKDAFVHSPLFLKRGWQDVFRHYLMHERTFERIGNDPEELFWEIVNEKAKGTAQDRKFLDTLSGPWRKLESHYWLVAPPQDDWIFCLHPEAVAAVSRRVGDARICKQLISKHFVSAHLPGRNSGMRQQTIATRHLEPETQAHIQTGHAAWIQKQQHKQHPTTEATNAHE